MKTEFLKQLDILFNNMKHQSADLLKSATRIVEIQSKIINVIQQELDKTTRKEEREPEARA